MNRYIEPIHDVNKNITYDILRKNGFIIYGGQLIYRFPVYKYNGRALIYCNFIYDEEESCIYITVKDINDNAYGYNTEYYGKSCVINKINETINMEINKLHKDGVLVK